MDIERLKAVGPKRRGAHVWPAAQRLIERHLEDGQDFEQMVKGWSNYATHCRQTGSDGTEFVLMARTFFGRDMHWLEWCEMDMRTPQQKRQDEQWEALEMRAKALGFSTVDRSKGLTLVDHVIKEKERERERSGVSGQVVELAAMKRVAR